MTRLPALFFASAAIFATIGMAWGIQMSATQDHTLSPAHAHLNLIGFALMSAFGAFYALCPSAVNRLAWAHYALHVVAVLVLTPGIVLALTERGEALAKAGSVLAILSMAVFLLTTLRTVARPG